jgi:hypothetical protein
MSAARFLLASSASKSRRGRTAFFVALFLGATRDAGTKAVSHIDVTTSRYSSNLFKAEYGYRADGDLRVQSGSGRVFVGLKRGSAGDMEPTNYRIANGKAVFDPPTIGSGGEGDPFEFPGE